MNFGCRIRLCGVLLVVGIAIYMVNCFIAIGASAKRCLEARR